jgi:hypothetical protein
MMNYDYNEKKRALEDKDGYVRTELTYRGEAISTMLEQNLLAKTTATATEAATAATSLLSGKLKNGSAISAATCVTIGRPDTTVANGYMDIASTTTTTYMAIRKGTGGNDNQGLSVECPGTGTIGFFTNGPMIFNGQKSNQLRMNGGDAGAAPSIYAHGGTDADVDIQLIPKGTGIVKTGWGYWEAYANVVQALTHMQMTSINTSGFAPSGNTFPSLGYNSSTGVFTNNSGRPMRLMISYNIGTAQNYDGTFETYIMKRSSADALLGRYAAQVTRGTGVAPIYHSSCCIIQLAASETFRNVAYHNPTAAGTSLNIGSTNFDTNNLYRITITQIG